MALTDKEELALCKQLDSIADRLEALDQTLKVLVSLRQGTYGTEEANLGRKPRRTAKSS